MTWQRFFLLLAALTIAAMPGLGEPVLQDVDPNESAAVTYSKRFSYADALRRLKQIKSALNSFGTLTQIAAGKIANKDIVQVGNTEWEIQNLGFTNWVRSVEGTLRKQHYMIKKLECDLAEFRYNAGRISKQVLDEKRRALQQAEESFHNYWKAFNIAD